MKTIAKIICAITCIPFALSMLSTVLGVGLIMLVVNIAWLIHCLIVLDPLNIPIEMGIWVPLYFLGIIHLFVSSKYDIEPGYPLD